MNWFSLLGKLLCKCNTWAIADALAVSCQCSFVRYETLPFFSQLIGCGLLFRRGKPTETQITGGNWGMPELDIDKVPSLQLSKPFKKNQKTN